jgi:hypothetical protein
VVKWIPLISGGALCLLGLGCDVVRSHVIKRAVGSWLRSLVAEGDDIDVRIGVGRTIRARIRRQRGLPEADARRR